MEFRVIYEDGGRVGRGRSGRRVENLGVGRQKPRKLRLQHCGLPVLGWVTERPR